MRYTDSHEWITVDGLIGTVGITEYAQKELGDIVYIELPKVGQEMRAGEEACILESTKSAVDVYSPASGRVIEVNELFRLNPSSLKKMPHLGGWLFRLKLSNPSEIEDLLTLEQYQGFRPS